MSRPAIAAAQAQVAAARADLYAAQQVLDDTAIRAPFDAVVSEVAIAPGNTAASGTTALTLVDMQRLTIDLVVGENDIVHIAPELAVELQPQALPGMVIIGTVQAVYDLTVAHGRMLSEQDVHSRAAVAVLGANAADNPFAGQSSVIGRTLKIGNRQLKVVGVLAARGGTAFGSVDDAVLIPLPLTPYLSDGRNRPADEATKLQAITVRPKVPIRSPAWSPKRQRCCAGGTS